MKIGIVGFGVPASYIAKQAEVESRISDIVRMTFVGRDEVVAELKKRAEETEDDTLTIIRRMGDKAATYALLNRHITKADQL